MLHPNFQGHRPFGSSEDFFKVFTIYGHGIHVGHVIWTNLNNLSFPNPMETPHEIWLQLAQRFLRKRSLKMLNLSDLGPRSM